MVGRVQFNTAKPLSNGTESDGLTPYHRLKGKPWKIDLPSLGECIGFKKRTNTKPESGWESGSYLGVKENTTERIVGSLSGIFIVQSVRRKPEEERWNPDLVKGLKGNPRDPIPGQEAGGTSGSTLGMPIFLGPGCPEVPRVAPEIFGKQVQNRKHYILKGDLDKYGYAPNCPACSEARAGAPRTGGVFHSPECRARIEARMAEDPLAKERPEKSHVRQTERLGLRDAGPSSGREAEEAGTDPNQRELVIIYEPAKEGKIRYNPETEASTRGDGRNSVRFAQCPGKFSGGDRGVDEEKKEK